MNDATKQRLKRIAPWVGYPIFYLFCVVVFFSWTFPYDRLKERIIAQFNAQQKNQAHPQELQIEELDSSWVTGVKAMNVKLITPSSDPKKKPAELRIDEARARISLLGLLVGNRNVSFRVDAFDGLVKGTFSDTGKERRIDVEIEGLDLARVDMIAASAGFPLEGRLDGTVSLELPEGKASKGNGTISLEVQNMVAGNAKELPITTKLGPFTLPRLKVGTFSVAGEAKDGVMKISKVSASGGDVDVSGDGRVQLREVATDAMLDVSLKFKINDSYRMKDEKTKLLFGTPDGKDKPMLEMDPNMAKAKTPDGFYALRVGGTLGKPDPRPNANSLAPGFRP